MNKFTMNFLCSMIVYDLIPTNFTTHTLLTNKTQTTNNELDPFLIMVDFEKAAIFALKRNS